MYRSSFWNLTRVDWSIFVEKAQGNAHFSRSQAVVGLFGVEKEKLVAKIKSSKQTAWERAAHPG